MTFYGKQPESQPADEPKTKRFVYKLGPDDYEEVRAHAVYFYESGHIGFWNNRTANSAGQLVLAIKALAVWEEPE
jgi:hypothetical protein